MFAPCTFLHKLPSTSQCHHFFTGVMERKTHPLSIFERESNKISCFCVFLSCKSGRLFRDHEYALFSFADLMAMTTARVQIINLIRRNKRQTRVIFPIIFFKVRSVSAAEGFDVNVILRGKYSCLIAYDLDVSAQRITNKLLVGIYFYPCLRLNSRQHVTVNPYTYLLVAKL